MNNPSYSFLSARFIFEISLISVHFRYTCPASKIRFTMEWICFLRSLFHTVLTYIPMRLFFQLNK